MISLTSEPLGLAAHVGHVCLGRRYVKASKGFTPSGPVTDKALIIVALQQFNFSVLFFFFPLPVSLFLSHAQKHTYRTQLGTQKQMYGISFDSNGEFGLLSAFCPLLCPTYDLHLFYQAHAYMLFFFAGQAGRVLLSSTYFMGSDEAGWHSRTHGVGLGVHKVWKQSNLVQTPSVIHKVDVEVGNCTAVLYLLYWTVENHWWTQVLMWRLA